MYICALLALDFLHLEGLDDVAELDVVESAEVDTGLVTFLDRLHVVLETTQRGYLQVVDRGDAVAQDTALSYRA